MREVKFRAWDKCNEKMVSWWDIRNHYNLLSMLDSVCTDYDLYDVMQYIGLKDRNGVEIYEGDILHWEDLSNMSDSTLKDNVRVFWDDEYLRWSIETLGDVRDVEKLYDYSDVEEIEVIGTIFENPELLKQEGTA